MHEDTFRKSVVLAIDDSEFVHRLLRVRLKGEALDLRNAYSGEEGLVRARASVPDAILLDIDMPGMNGFEVLMELKSDPDLHEVPVVIISSFAGTENMVRGLDLGAFDFVGKPFNIAELKARIRSALRMSSLIRMLATRAKVDGLTALWNRHYFNERLAIEIAHAERHGRPLALLMCDIDHFKRLNDQHGHPFGDRVLQVVGSMLGNGRSGDIACRYGGEEFAVILPETSRDAALATAERLRERLPQQCWDGHHGLSITMSIGLATLDNTTAGADALVVAADTALYAAKSNGRNRVCAYGDEHNDGAPPLRRTA